MEKTSSWIRLQEGDLESVIIETEDDPVLRLEVPDEMPEPVCAFFGVCPEATLFLEINGRRFGPIPDHITQPWDVSVVFDPDNLRVSVNAEFLPEVGGS